MNYRAAIIGFGGMGQRHYSAYKKNNVDVVAICDWDTERVLSRLPDFPKGSVYNSHDTLFNNSDIDIVSVVTNGPTHAEIAVKAARAGVKNIFCEKPVATNLKDAQKVIDVCRDNEARLAVNHIRRWSVDYRRIKEIVGSGVIGELKTLYFNCGSTGLGNFTSHFFDTARFLSGDEARYVVGFLDDTGTPNPRGAQFIDPAGYGIVWFRNGTRFMVDTSEQTGVQYLFQIVGRYGRIIIDELNNSWLIRGRGTGDRDLPLTRYGASMPVIPFESSEFDIVELTALGQAELLAGGTISCSGEDGMRSLEIVIAFHVSEDKENQRISLPLNGPDMEKDVSIG